MKAQQLLDLIIKPVHIYMGGNYHSNNASISSLSTSAIESDCGKYVEQIGGGPALGWWQMEHSTHHDIWANCDALRNPDFVQLILSLGDGSIDSNNLKTSPMYACAMARLKYAMDVEPLPNHRDIGDIYKYYKRIYNTEGGASTYDKFEGAFFNNKINKVKL